MSCFPILFSFFHWSILIGPSSKKIKKLKLGRLPKIIWCEDGVPPIWLIYISEKERTFGQMICDKLSCYWEHPQEHWELEEHNWKHMKTDWEQDRNTRIEKNHPQPTPCPQGEKMNPLGCIFNNLIGGMHILFLDMVATIVFCLS